MREENQEPPLKWFPEVDRKERNGARKTTKIQVLKFLKNQLAQMKNCLIPLKYNK